MKLKNIPILILAGGKGTRVQHILKDTPKPLYPIHKFPFLDYLLGYLNSFGFQKFYLSIGYKSELFEKYYENREDIFLIKETYFLGTGGAVLNSLNHIAESDFLVLNGDTLYNLDYNKFINFCKSKGEFPVIAIKETNDAKRFGSIQIDKEQKILAFKEKDSNNNLSSWINAGIYFFKKKYLKDLKLPEVNSIEFDIFPLLAKTGLFAFKSKGEFIDIGTPETLGQIEKFIHKNKVLPLKIKH